MRRDLARCYVLCESGESRVIGYYTLSAISVEVVDLPEEVARMSGRYQVVPAVLLGRLAVDAGYQGRDLSTILIVNALRRSLRTGVGVKLIVVDALNEVAAAFWERRGFHRFEDNPLRLFMTMHTVRSAFPGEDADGLRVAAPS